MSGTPHVEQHFTATQTVRDIVIGMSDGLTVPFTRSYIAGGLIPLSPYMWLSNLNAGSCSGV